MTATAACRCGHERADHSPAREDDFGCRKCACNGFAAAAGIPWEGTDCTPDEAVEAVQAVRATAALRPSSEGRWEKPRTVAELLDEAVKLRNLIYYAAPANSDLERDANRLGRVLYLLREEISRG